MRSSGLWSRRKLLSGAGKLAGAAIAGRHHPATALSTGAAIGTPAVSAHLWVYASKYPPKYDATPVLEDVFRDLQFTGYSGVELMDTNLTHDDAVERIHNLSTRFNVPVTGCSFGADMWDEKRHDLIATDAEIVIRRLGQLKGRTFGISVGDAMRMKTDAELDTQASLLRQLFALCATHGIQPNLHNHTYEVQNGMHDLKGTLERLPDARLGPDLNWLIRGGVDPVAFTKTYGKKMVYMHLRDQYSNGSWTEYLGQGVTDFPAIAKALKDAGFQGRAAVELAFPGNFIPTQPLRRSWQMSRDYVHSTFGW